MKLTLTHIYRHPVKGLTPEPLDRVKLTPGEGLPNDRRFALVHGTTAFDPTAPVWMSKINFLMLMRNERLAKLRTRFDDATGTLIIRENGEIVASGNILEPEGQRAIEQFFVRYMGDEARGAPRMVEAAGHMFSDTARKVASIIGLASVRELERVVRASVDPRRFRANFYFEGGKPWQEFDWIGREIRLNGVRLRIVKAIDRCPATDVDPDSGARDMTIPVTLKRAFDHINMGVYGEVLDPGEVAVGDAFTPPTETPKLPF